MANPVSFKPIEGCRIVGGYGLRNAAYSRGSEVVIESNIARMIARVPATDVSAYRPGERRINTPLYSRRNSMLSASIAVYRAQAESFGGRSDGKFVVRL
jgi:hypothetical protein